MNTAVVVHTVVESIYDYLPVNTFVENILDLPSKGFADRLTYLRWLWTLEQRAFGDHGDFAAFIGVPPVLYHKWKDSPKASGDRETARRFLAGGLPALGVTAAWLLDGEGEPPKPALWGLWARVDAPARVIDVPSPGDRPILTGQNAATSKRTVAAKGRGRK